MLHAAQDFGRYLGGANGVDKEDFFPGYENPTLKEGGQTCMNYT